MPRFDDENAFISPKLCLSDIFIIPYKNALVKTQIEFFMPFLFETILNFEW